MIGQDDKALDDLITRFGDGYNSPPANPPLDLIRARVHSQRASRRRKTQWIWTGAIAAAFALFAAGISSRLHDLPAGRSSLHTSRTALEENTKQANEALDEAIEQAQAAVRAHPNDPFFVKHLEAMRENSQHFRELQDRAFQDAS